MGGAPLEGAGEIELSPFRTRVGAIQVAPLDAIDLGLVEARQPLSSGGDSGPQGGGGGSGPALPPDGSGEDGIGIDPGGRQPLLGGVDNRLPLTIPASRATANNDAPIPAPPSEPPPSEPPPVPPVERDLPQVVLVLVRTKSGSTGRALDGAALSEQTPTQHGVENSSIDLRQAGHSSFQVLSDRNLQNAGISQLNDSDLKLITTNAAFVGSQLLGGDDGDVYVLSARDLIRLGLFSNAEASASLTSTTASMVDSRLIDLDGNNLIALQANTQLGFIGLGDPGSASLAFDLLTQGLRDALIELGGGDDTLTVVSGFRGGLGNIGIETTIATSAGGGTSPGIQFALPDAYRSLAEKDVLSFRLKATAMGLQDSRIDTGDGNDEVAILTRIDTDLKRNLGSVINDSRTSIDQEQIGMLRSALEVGAGDDRVRINGDVIDSTIDLGEGNNTLILEGSLLGSSRILSGGGQNMISVSGDLGGALRGSTSNDTFLLNSLALVGQLDGGGGRDAITSGSRPQRDLALIQGRDQGFLGALQFDSVESLDLGGGDDVALVSLEGTLSGVLLGGDGLDRIEFSNWDLPVVVDLDLGSANAVNAGVRGSLRGFEQVIGGVGNDVLASSGLFSGLDGAEGDDLLFLRWTPWLAPGRSGLDLRGGGGNDQIVIAGLETPIPRSWDGVSGIPWLSDLQLDLKDDDRESGDRLSWLRQGSGPDGRSNGQELIPLTPSGLDGLGDVRMLPIAPLGQLLAGMSDTTPQLAIALDSRLGGATGVAELRLLGSDGIGTSRLIAYLPDDNLSRQTQSLGG